MPSDDIVFAFPIEADPAAVVEAVNTADGVRGWWTDTAEVGGDRAVLTFADAEAPYEFAISEGGPQRVVWTTDGHPPNWDGTSITYEVGPGENGGAMMMFRHGPFPQDQERGFLAFFWGQIMGRLKAYAETGDAQPFMSGR
ncbi:MAG: hypothetical protein ACR2N6_07160 [Miltoncostaeaceae bacterium]